MSLVSLYPHSDTFTCLSPPSPAPPLPHPCLFLSSYLESLTELWQHSPPPHQPNPHPVSSILLPSHHTIAVTVVSLPLQHPRRAQAVSTVCLCSLLIRAKYIDRGRKRGLYQDRQAGRGTGGERMRWCRGREVSSLEGWRWPGRESDGYCVIRSGVQLMLCFLKANSKKKFNWGGQQIFCVNQFSLSCKRYFKIEFFIPELYFIAGYKNVHETASIVWILNICQWRKQKKKEKKEHLHEYVHQSCILIGNSRHL